MIFNTLTSFLALAASAAAAPNLVARAAPEVTYPHATTVWENSWWHNVTWTPQSGSGTIELVRGGNTMPLKQNVDLSKGRVAIQVPGSAEHATDYKIQITVGNDHSSSPAFGIMDHAIVASATSAASSAASSVVSAASSAASASGSAVSASASSIISSAASAASSVVASASSAISSSMAAGMSMSASASSASGSVVGSASSALDSASASILSAASSQLASAASSVSSGASAALSSATAPSSSASAAGNGAAQIGVTKFGVSLGAGLVALSVLSGAFIL